MLLLHIEVLNLNWIVLIVVLLVVLIVIMHFPFQLLLDLLIYELKEHLLIQSIVEVVRLVNSRS